MASDGVVNHFNAVRTRATGAGNMQMQLQSMDEVHTQTLANTALSLTTNREVTVLANFVDQRASVYIFTTNIDEIFEISRITVFLAPLQSSYPQ
jgi:hypothetical protein